MDKLVKNLLLSCLFIPSISAEEIPVVDEELKTLLALDIEQLTKISIASKKEESLLDATAAVYVITQEDIQRSGLNSVPELLRLVPGMQVASVDSNTWAISTRDVNEQFSRKLLVMIDGRSVYTPVFAGVTWDIQNLVLDDIEQIEIIRGPGGTLWGENAVNGVINILTKHAKDTQDGLISGGVGNVENGFADLRYGWSPGEQTHARVYAKYFDRDSFDKLDGSDGPGDWSIGQAGFRMDHEFSLRDTLLFEGDYYDGESGRELTDLVSLAPITTATAKDDQKVSGGNLLSRWKHIAADGSKVKLQAYFDHTSRETNRVNVDVSTLDIEFQHNFSLNNAQEIVWGLSHRSIYSDTDGGFVVSFDPESDWNHVSSGFLQDDIWLSHDKIKLTLGSKFSYNSFSGFEYQPNIRLLWKVNPNQSVWAAISRAVRTPSIVEESVRFNTAAAPGPILFSIFGNDDVESEELLAYEIGYRAYVNNQFSFDVAVFYNDYENIPTQEQGALFVETTPSPTHFVFPTTFDNKSSGEIYGIELNSSWQVVDQWLLEAWLALQKIELHADKSHFNSLLDAEAVEGNSSDVKFHIRSYFDLTDNLDFDTLLYYVDDIPSQDIPDYLRLDLRLGWEPVNNFNISMVGQNLLDPRHPEFAAEQGSNSVEVERSFYIKMSWEF